MMNGNEGGKGFPNLEIHRATSYQHVVRMPRQGRHSRLYRLLDVSRDPPIVVLIEVAHRYGSGATANGELILCNKWQRGKTNDKWHSCQIWEESRRHKVEKNRPQSWILVCQLKLRLFQLSPTCPQVRSLSRSTSLFFVFLSLFRSVLTFDIFLVLPFFPL